MREDHPHLLRRAAHGLEDARLPRQDIGPARQRVDDRHSLAPHELHQRLVGIEAVEDAQIGLIRIGSLVLILVGRQVESAGQADDAVGVHQARRDFRRD